MKIKCLIFAFLCFLKNTNCMGVSQYDRSATMPVWESDYLVTLAVRYDGVGSTVGQDLFIGVPGYFSAQLVDLFVQQFIACTRNGVVEYPNGAVGNLMNPILLAHAQNPVGREMMYRIMAKLEPRMQCVDSIRAIIDGMNRTLALNPLDGINICANLLVELGIIRNDNANNCMKDLSNLELGIIQPNKNFNNLINNPVTFILNTVFQCTDRSTLAEFNIPSTAIITGVNNVILILNIHANALGATIDNLRFRLVFDATAQDQYDSIDNTITITGQSCDCNLVTGPILGNSFRRTYVETRWQALQSVSTLKHELGHYLRIGLEGVISDPSFLSVGPALFAIGVLSSEYITHLVDIWGFMFFREYIT